VRQGTARRIGKISNKRMNSSSLAYFKNHHWRSRLKRSRFWLPIGKVPVHVSAGTLATRTEVTHGFPPSLQANVGLVHYSRSRPPAPTSLFTISQQCSAIWSPCYCQSVYISYKYELKYRYNALSENQRKILYLLYKPAYYRIIEKRGAAVLQHCRRVYAWKRRCVSYVKKMKEFICLYFIHLSHNINTLLNTGVW
jgi:hypothetical protein